MDAYAILGVTRSATEQEIKLAFRKLAMLHHPDRPNGNEVKFKEISAAYALIGTPEKRKAHDQRYGPSLNNPHYNARANVVYEYYWDMGQKQQENYADLIKQQQQRHDDFLRRAQEAFKRGKWDWNQM